MTVDVKNKQDTAAIVPSCSSLQLFPACKDKRPKDGALLQIVELSVWESFLCVLLRR